MRVSVSGGAGVAVQRPGCHGSSKRVVLGIRMSEQNTGEDHHIKGPAGKSHDRDGLDGTAPISSARAGGVVRELSGWTTRMAERGGWRRGHADPIPCIIEF